MTLSTASRNFGSHLMKVFFITFVTYAFDAKAITIDWVPIGDAGNAHDVSTGSLYGGVGHGYSMAKYEVTNTQYAEFLNTKDPTGANTLGLWNIGMGNVSFDGIAFNPGNANGNKYTLIPGAENHPVNSIAWFDAIRFANWVNNGQGNGDTETGAYTLLGGSFTPTNANSITRNPGATVYLPSEDEWYKAAYFNPSTNSYFQYPTSSNSTPISSGPTNLPNHANFIPGGPGVLTDVGSYTGTTSPYGLFDMAGNVYEWNEVLVSGSFRGIRGGSAFHNSGALPSINRSWAVPGSQSDVAGFRLVSIPEPNLAGLVVAIFSISLVRALRRSVTG